MSAFSEFKKDFYARAGDGSLFDCGDVNLLKVVLDGLYIKYADRGHIHTPLFDSLTAHKRFLFLRRISMRFKGETEQQEEALKRARAAKGCPFLIVDPSGRSVQDENGKPRSIYFDRIVETLGKKNVFFVLENRQKAPYAHDLHFHAASKRLQHLPLEDEEILLREHMRETFRRIAEAKIFSERELKHIRMAFQVFFDFYRAWAKLVTILQPETVLFEQHYHREGFMLAMKRAGIRTIEMQHGLIAEEDIFYVFPPSVKKVIGKALFADRILVYGECWKQRLLKGCEYPEARIGLAGYYHFESRQEDAKLQEELKTFASGDRLLLITSQTDLQHYFIPYVTWLAKDIAAKKLPWKILFKPHPSEKKGTYDVLDTLGNAKVVSANLEHLFRASDLHLSIYSTTLFDAVRFGVKSYALYVPEYGDYVDSMAAAGVAVKTQLEENFLERAPAEPANTHPREFYYADFSPERFRAELNLPQTAAR